jgi:hypothetical protein
LRSFRYELHAQTSTTGLVETGFSTNIAIEGNVLDNKISTFRPGWIEPWKAGGAPIIAAWGLLNGFAYVSDVKGVLLRIRGNLPGNRILGFRGMPILRNFVV